jgi:dipeptide transport system permease protein
MLRFLLTRVSLVIPTFIGITLMVFVLIRLIPGDPIETLAGERGIDPVRHAQLLKDYGLDQPVLVQYGYYLAALCAAISASRSSPMEPVIASSRRCFPPPSSSPPARSCSPASRPAAGMLARVRRNRSSITASWGYRSPAIRCRSSGGALLLILLFSVQFG